MLYKYFIRYNLTYSIYLINNLYSHNSRCVNPSATRSYVIPTWTGPDVVWTISVIPLHVRYTDHVGRYWTSRLQDSQNGPCGEWPRVIWSAPHPRGWDQVARRQEIRSSIKSDRFYPALYTEMYFGYRIYNINTKIVLKFTHTHWNLIPISTLQRNISIPRSWVSGRPKGRAAYCDALNDWNTRANNTFNNCPEQLYIIFLHINKWSMLEDCTTRQLHFHSVKYNNKDDLDLFSGWK